MLGGGAAARKPVGRRLGAAGNKGFSVVTAGASPRPTWKAAPRQTPICKGDMPQTASRPCLGAKFFYGRAMRAPTLNGANTSITLNFAFYILHFAFRT